MKALTVRQPWASLIVGGFKDVENRTWPLHPDHHYMPLMIHAAAKYDTQGWINAMRPCVDSGAGTPLALLLTTSTDPDMQRQSGAPRGVLLGTVAVIGCHQGRKCEADEGLGCSRWADEDPDVWHWTLRNPQPLAEPVPYKGRQGLWTVPDDVVKEAA